MALINPLVNRKCRAIEPGFSIASYSTMDTGAVSYFLLLLARFVSHDSMVSSRRIIS